MRKYKASEIVERALHLADLKNTDFLSHWEHEQYLNDAWRMVYQWLINKGDKQFVEEVVLYTSGVTNAFVEYDLPENLYQIESLKDYNSGREIPRKASTESINSNTYDIVNNKLRLYGTTSSNLLLTYWTVPEWITFPAPVYTCPVTISNKEIVASNGDVVLVKSNNYLVAMNARTGEVLADNITDSNNGIVGIDADHELLLEIYDYRDAIYKRTLAFDGTVLKTHNSSGWEAVVVPSNDNQCWWAELNTVSSIEISNALGTEKITIPSNELTVVSYNKNPIIKYGEYFVGYKDNILKFFDATGVVKTIEMPLEVKALSVSKEVIYVTCYNAVNYLIDSDGAIWDGIPYRIGSQTAFTLDSYTALLDSGLLDTHSKTKTTITDITPDTEFNFPNELYIQLLAADLAVRYAMKQNADTAGLNNLYESMKNTFMNTLSQSAGYTRMKNIYRG